MYFESAAEWLLNGDVILKVHDMFRNTVAADDIAWLMVENGWAGECEGNVPCYMRWQNHLNGEYLRRHPRGRHADEANRDLTRTLSDIIDNLEKSVLDEFDPDVQCDELHADLDPLVTAIRASRSQAKARALAATGRYARLCRRR